MPSCTLCKSDKTNDIKYGEFLQKGKIAVHTFCLYFSSNLAQRGRTDDEGFLGFLEPDIKNEERRISQLNCCYCHKAYANIGCCEKKCRRTFHLICGMENGTENQFAKTFQSFCNMHIRKTSARPSKEDACCICYDSIWDKVDNEDETVSSSSSSAAKIKRKFDPIEMLQAPCCHNGWFHKYCLLKFARTSGYFFKCPLCNDKKKFCKELPYKGIFIPSRDAEWEIEPNAFQELLQRPNTCSARPCTNRRGPDHTSSGNPLLMCSTCGSVAIHKGCMTVRSQTFDCEECTSVLKSDSGHESLHSQNNAESVLDDDDDDMDREIDVCNTDTEASEADVHKVKTIESDDSEERIPRVNRSTTRKLVLVSSSDDDSRSNFDSSQQLSQPPGHYNEEDDYDDDPLENFEAHMRRKLEQTQPNDEGIGHGTCSQRSSPSTQENRARLHGNAAHTAKCMHDDDVQTVPQNKRSPAGRIPDKESPTPSSEPATDESEEDPLENVHTYLNRNQGASNLDISCIARRTRRRSGQSADTPTPTDNKVATRIPKRRATCHIIDDSSSNSSWDYEIVPKRLRRRTTNTALSTTEDDDETRPTPSYTGVDYSTKPSASGVVAWHDRADPSDHNHKNNALEISCIANRTRRKSTHSTASSNQSDDVSTDESTRNRFKQSESTEEEEKNILDISCIAKRTRHRSSTSSSQTSDSSYTFDSLSLINRRRRRKSSYGTPKLDDIFEEESYKTPTKGGVATNSSLSSKRTKGNSDDATDSDILKKPTQSQRRSLQRITSDNESTCSSTSSASSSSLVARNLKNATGPSGRIATPTVKIWSGSLINKNEKNIQGKRKLYQSKNEIEEPREAPKNFARSYGFLVSNR